MVGGERVRAEGGVRLKIEFPDKMVLEVVSELNKIRNKVGELDMGHSKGRYAMVKSVAEASRQAEARQKEWDLSPLGQLLQVLQDAQRDS